MAGKGLVPFTNSGLTFDLYGEIALANGIVAVGNLLMEEVQALKVKPLAVILPKGRSRATRGLTLPLNRVLALAKEDTKIACARDEPLPKANNGQHSPKGGGESPTTPRD